MSRPLYTAAQLDAGRAIAGAALDKGYSLSQAAGIARCYVNHTPTMKGSR